MSFQPTLPQPTPGNSQEPVKRELFGGAITALYPSSYFDVSNTRPVQSHQEVYMEYDGVNSVIVDILERVKAETDEKAMYEHVSDILLSFEGNRRMLPITRRTITFMRNGAPVQFPLLLQSHITIPSQKFKGDVIDYDQACVFSVGLIRLEQFDTDIVVSANISRLQGSFKSTQDLVEDVFKSQLAASRSTLEMVLSKFELHNWNLFGGEKK